MRTLYLSAMERMWYNSHPHINHVLTSHSTWRIRIIWKCNSVLECNTSPIFPTSFQEIKKSYMLGNMELAEISWVNGKWSAFLSRYSSLTTAQSAVLHNTCHIYPFTHTFIHWWRRLPCKAPPAHQEQFGTLRTGDLPITRRPALPTEPQPPQSTSTDVGRSINIFITKIDIKICHSTACLLSERVVTVVVTVTRWQTWLSQGQ